MKAKNIAIVIFCALIVILVVIMCGFAKIKKDVGDKKTTEFESRAMLTSDLVETTGNKKTETGTQQHTECTQDTITEKQTSVYTATQGSDNKGFSSSEEWKSVYIKFIEDEKRDKKFTLTDFEYAFVAMKEFENPVLLIHDDWNMYLYYELNGTIYQAKEKNGDPLALQRMDSAYTKRGNLYLEGAVSVPSAFYLSQVVFDDGFSLKYIAEGNKSKDGEITYHDNQGNIVSEYDYYQARNKVMVGAKQVSFEKP